MSKRRVDPSDGEAYSFEQISTYYKRQWPSTRIAAYWDKLKPYEPRFQQGDRVLCNVGERRLLGTVLEVDVEDPQEPGEHVAYVVKTDAFPGFESRTISAPYDSDLVIMRERCFDVTSECTFAKWAAPIAKTKKPLRFGLQRKVGIRVSDDAAGYEQWASGRVVEIWPKLPGKPRDGFLTSADSVAYQVQTDDGQNLFCHRDEHTLIRSIENIPQTRKRGLSKRFEQRKLPDGTVVQFDHVTLRSRTIKHESSDQDADAAVKERSGKEAKRFRELGIDFDDI